MYISYSNVDYIFIHSPKKYSSKLDKPKYYMASIVLGTGNTTMNKTDDLCLHEALGETSY